MRQSSLPLTMLLAGVVVFAIVLAILQHTSNYVYPFQLVVKTKGANDIVHSEAFTSLKRCLIESRTYHDGGYEVDCVKVRNQ